MGKKAKRAKDKFYHLAKAQGLRARSAFKLMQLDSKFNFLSKAQVVIDLCAAPGGWLQIAAKYTPISALIVGVDLMPINHIPKCITHVQDITTPQCRTVLRKDLGTKLADVVLHDGAPNVGAAWTKDAYSQSELVLHSLKLAVEFLRPGGLFVTKVFRSRDFAALKWVFGQLFDRVDVTKPVSSRTASAEIFVVCSGYKAPKRIDPKLLSPHYVFKELDAGFDGPRVVDVMHSKAGVQKRNREGYDPSLGQTLHRKTPVSAYLNADDPVRVLSEANQLVFDDPLVLEHGATTSEVKACCTDLKLLGKPEFKLLLRWRSAVLRTRRFEAKKARQAAAAARGVEPESEDSDDSATRAAAEEEDRAAEDLARLQARAKRVKKKAAREKQKQLRRKALGIDGNAVDIVDDPSLFSLATIRNKEELDAIVDVNLDKVTADEVGGAVRSGDEGSDGEPARAEILDTDVESEDESGSDSEESDHEAYQRQLEEQLDRDYRRYLNKHDEREAEGPAHRPGIKLTRRQRMEAEAKQLQDQLSSKIDYEHQQYLRMLAAAGGGSSWRRGSDAGEASGASDESDSEDDGFFDPPAGALVKTGKDLAPEAEDGQPSAAARAARWFSNPEFDDDVADIAVAGLPSSRRPAAGAGAGAAQAASDSDSDGDGLAEASSGDDNGRGGGSRQGVGVLAPGRTGDTDSEASSDDDFEDPMAGLPISDRQRRKERLKRAASKAASKASLQKKNNGGGFEVVAAVFSDSDDDAPAPLTDKQREAQELIRAGMGTALDKEARGGGGSGAAGRKGGFEVVPVGVGARLTAVGGDGDDDAPPSTSAADVDPRLLDYDSDTHAQMLSLGLMMRRHTTAKALVDAAYNRYAFDDPALPKWFADDEKQHFRPQLPVTREQVDAIKEQFREVVARPIKKVAEARARKRNRMVRKLDKAKAKAAALANNSELTEAAKMKVVAAMVHRAKASVNTTQHKKVALDRRLLADKRAAKAEAKAKARTNSKPSTKTSRGKHKVRHKRRRK